MVFGGVGAAVAVAAFAPPAAVAHPCVGASSSEAGRFLSLNASTWAGLYPTEIAHDCEGDQNIYAPYANVAAAADPVGPAVETFDYTPNMTPVGYSARVVPSSGATFPNSAINSDLAFQGKYAYQGTYAGFRVIDISDPANPEQKVNYTGCSTGQGDVVVYKNVLVRSWDSPVGSGAAATASCGGQLAGQGFEGVHIFDISDPLNPVFVRQLRFSQQGMPTGALTGCGSHTATAVPHDASDTLYIYNGGSSGTCTWMDVLKIDLKNLNNASLVGRAAAQRQCHDNQVIIDGANSRAVCAGGNGFSVFKFDTTIDPAADGGIEKPTLMYSKPLPPVNIAHSSTFSYDGKTLVFGWEPNGGTQPECEASDTIEERTLFFFDTDTGTETARLLHPRLQTSAENCTWHNFNTIPTKGGNVLVSGNYQAGIIVVDFTNRAAPQVIGYADPRPLPRLPNGNLAPGGDWATYWHNGRIYESDIYRGMIVWDLDNAFADRAKTFEVSNPQTQIGVYQGDNDKPTVSIAAPLAGGQFLQNSAQAADFSCADVGLGVESCVGSVADGANIDTSRIGYHTFTVTATDNAGNVTTQSVEYVVNSTAVQSTPGAQVAPTLSLSLGAAPTFPNFVPGVGAAYTATTLANVVTTAGDGVLSVSDPSSNATGRLVNGAFSLAAPVQARASSAGGTGGALATVGGSAAPTSLLTYDLPKSNDQVTLSFSQAIGQNEALRSGTYSKALTFTLSTTSP
jgi:hypothetical protein